MRIPRLLVFLFLLSVFVAVPEFSDSMTVNADMSSGSGNSTDNLLFLDNDFFRNEQDILNLINKERQKNGLNMLWIDKELQAVARRYSQKMANEHYFGHYDSQGEAVDERVRKIRGFKKIGENLFFSTGKKDLPKTSVKEWMNSKSHRRNILDSIYKYTGIGIAQSRDGSIYITQIFLAQ